TIGKTDFPAGDTLAAVFESGAEQRDDLIGLRQLQPSRPGGKRRDLSMAFQGRDDLPGNGFGIGKRDHAISLAQGAVGIHRLRGLIAIPSVAIWRRLPTRGDGQRKSPGSLRGFSSQANAWRRSIPVVIALVRTFLADADIVGLVLAQFGER